jgi:tetratricopeptide (TPR) repeat protein
MLAQLTPRLAAQADNRLAQSPVPQQAATGPEDDLFTYASLALSSGYFNVAANRLQVYLDTYPNGRHVEEAYFRLGECRLKLGDNKAAEKAYNTLISMQKEGDLISLAAYRVASLNYQSKNISRALVYFTIAADAALKKRQRLTQRIEELQQQGDTNRTEKTRSAFSDNENLWLSSAYYRAYCLQATGRSDQAIAAYRAVTAKRENNQYLDSSLREIVRLTTASGDKEATLDALNVLAATTTKEEMRTEAKIRAAILYGDAGDAAKAKAILEEVLKTDPGGYWGAVGHYTLLQLFYKEENYQAVGPQFGMVEIEQLPDNLRPKLLLTVANSQRKLQQYIEAIDSYDTIEQYYRDSEQSVEAGYLKLICFYKINADDLPEFVSHYVLKMTKRDTRTFVDRALLLEAEHHFRKGEYAAAGTSYASIDPQNIPEQLRPSMLYNRGWCESESGQYKQAIQTLTRFIANYPESPLLPSVYASRGLSYRRFENTPGALADFEHVIANYPTTAAAEMAFQQSGLIYGEQQDWKRMVAAFDGLIKQFPESLALAEAHFFSGKGRFDLRQFEEAIPLLRKAAELDSDYRSRAQMRIVLCNYFLQRPDDLAEEINILLNADPGAAIDPKVFSWLGAKRFEEKDYPQAAFYLRLGVTPDTPEDTLPIVWMYLAQAESKSGLHEGAIEAIDFYLEQTRNPTSKARGYLIKAGTLLAAGQFAEADESAREGLRLQKEGRINAELLIAQGDIAMARGDHRDAAAKYIVVSEIFMDPVITPSALKKAAEAYQQAGDEKQANQMLAELERRFPKG